MPLVFPIEFAKTVAAMRTPGEWLDDMAEKDGAVALTDVGEVAKTVGIVTTVGMKLHEEHQHHEHDEAARQWRADWARAVAANDADAMSALLEQQRLARVSNGAVG